MSEKVADFINGIWQKVFAAIIVALMVWIGSTSQQSAVLIEKALMKLEFHDKLIDDNSSQIEENKGEIKDLKHRVGCVEHKIQKIDGTE